MKTTRSVRPTRAARKSKERGETNYQNALQLCEKAAAQVKAASEELVACWASLGRDLSQGAPQTELLRRRAWCNVLELRLKERAHILEDARHSVDAVWSQLMLDARGREMFRQFKSQCAEEGLFHRSWSLLVQPGAASAQAAAHHP